MTPQFRFSRRPVEQTATFCAHASSQLRYNTVQIHRALATVRLFPAIRSHHTYFSRRLPAFFAVLLLVIAVTRVVATYQVLSQAADEPATIAAGMEWLDRGTYALDPFHPPLARVAAALGPFAEGLRFPAKTVVESQPELPGDRFATMPSVFRLGDDILYAGGHYWRTLALARLGMVPFFAFGVFLVYAWTRELAGEIAALLAVVFFTTLPPILAFTGFAYTDMPVAVFIAASAFVLTRWLQRPSTKTAILFGVVTACAALCKFTSLLFLPACWVAALCCWIWLGRNRAPDWRSVTRAIIWAGLAFLLLSWAGYRFSVGPLRTAFAQPEQDIRALHLPGSLSRVLDYAADLPVPAPPVFKGLAGNFRTNALGRPSYLLGNIRHTGWWYFFVVAVGVKTPLAFLLLALLGIVASLVDSTRKHCWLLAVPSACVFAVLLSTTWVKVDYGVRHILCIYSFLAVLGGYGAMALWRAEGAGRWTGRMLLAGLLIWHLISTFRAHPDYVAYFNELAGQHPERILLWGCDYDCGQDTARLAQLLKERHVAHVGLSVFGSADFARLGFPPFEILDPYQQATGWVAASIRRLETGDTFSGGSHRDGFKWLEACSPVARAGKTVYLYYLPCETSGDFRPPGK